MESKEAGNRPGEFGGYPGLYGNIDQPIKNKIPNVAPRLTPNQARMALMQTNPSDSTSVPSHGNGGVSVQK